MSSVHIAISNPKADWVIARFARYLHDLNGWSLGTGSQRAASCNLYFPYLDWRFTCFLGTPVGAFMTHLETGNSMKVKWWNQTRAKMNLLVTMAEQYRQQLLPYNPNTVNITPPVEAQFVPAPPKERGRPTVGFSGNIYRGGRKGENLAAKLVTKRAMWDFKASGAKGIGDKKNGWTVPTKSYSWRDMPRFYQSLDVLVCTSLIEGGPVTILEALACGRPVVVPEGVGLIDELPDVGGIYRYKAGDYTALADACDRALECRETPEQLHDIVADRTVERYAEEWEAAVEGILSPAIVPVQDRRRPNWTTKGRAGFFLVAFGKQAHDTAYHLIPSLHKHNPGIPVALCCEGFADEYDSGGQANDAACPLPENFRKVMQDGDVVIAKPIRDRRARQQKTHVWDLAPAEWEYVAYCDVDMICIAPLTMLFQPLQDGYDMVFTTSSPQAPLVKHAQRGKYKEENAYTTRFLGSDRWLQIAGGVWSFRRNARTHAWCDAFHREWKRYGHKDQQAMMRALWQVPVRYWLLGTEFNTFVHHGMADRCIGLLHFATAARSWVEKHDGRRLWREYVDKHK